ncbi:hypothetical protein PR048_013898 [Dryococelus australis]|uniref:Uncharacterized protein n=1 Tax=Dryococelus australis TaxID=614101 RepID=A0ABQ9HUB5_9NEOP|nr:hypothetical protein PR048_013898 [Dryococelus australis]
MGDITDCTGTLYHNTWCARRIAFKNQCRIVALLTPAPNPATNVICIVTEAGLIGKHNASPFVCRMLTFLAQLAIKFRSHRLQGLSGCGVTFFYCTLADMTILSICSASDRTRTYSTSRTACTYSRLRTCYHSGDCAATMNDYTTSRSPGFVQSDHTTLFKWVWVVIIFASITPYDLAHAKLITNSPIHMVFRIGSVGIGFSRACLDETFDFKYPPVRLKKVEMEHQRNASVEDTGEPRENPLTNGNVPHEHTKIRVTQPGVEPTSSWCVSVTWRDCDNAPAHGGEDGVEDTTLGAVDDLQAGDAGVQHGLERGLEHAVRRHLQHHGEPRHVGDRLAKPRGRAERAHQLLGLLEAATCDTATPDLRRSSAHLFTLAAGPLRTLQPGDSWSTTSTSGGRRARSSFSPSSATRASRSHTECECRRDMWGRGKREIPEKTRRPAASSGTIPTRENPGVAPTESNSVRLVSGSCSQAHAQQALVIKVGSETAGYRYVAQNRMRHVFGRDCTVASSDTSPHMMVRDDMAELKELFTPVSKSQKYNIVKRAFAALDGGAGLDKKNPHTIGISFNQSLALLETMTHTINNWRKELCHSVIAKAQKICFEWDVSTKSWIQRKRIMPAENADYAELSIQQEIRRYLTGISDILTDEISVSFSNLRQMEKRFGFFFCKSEEYVNSVNTYSNEHLHQVNMKCTALGKLYPFDLSSIELIPTDLRRSSLGVKALDVRQAAGVGRQDGLLGGDEASGIGARYLSRGEADSALMLHAQLPQHVHQPDLQHHTVTAHTMHCCTSLNMLGAPLCCHTRVHRQTSLFLSECQTSTPPSSAQGTGNVWDNVVVKLLLRTGMDGCSVSVKDTVVIPELVFDVPRKETRGSNPLQEKREHSVTLLPLNFTIDTIQAGRCRSPGIRHTHTLPLDRRMYPEGISLAHGFLIQVASNHLTTLKARESLRQYHSAVSHCLLTTAIADHVFHAVDCNTHLHGSDGHSGEQAVLEGLAVAITQHGLDVDSSGRKRLLQLADRSGEGRQLEQRLAHDRPLALHAGEYEPQRPRLLKLPRLLAPDSPTNCVLVKGFKVYSVRLRGLGCVPHRYFRHYLPVPGVGNLFVCCLPWMWLPFLRLPLQNRTLIPGYPLQPWQAQNLPSTVDKTDIVSMRHRYEYRPISSKLSRVTKANGQDESANWF